MRDSNASWQKILADGFTSTAELLTFLELPLSLGSIDAALQFKTRVPRGFAALMEKGNPNDPLLLQVLAQHHELLQISEYGLDPLQEADANPTPGLIHKYTGRVLLTLTGACAIHCRYCFRRHFPYTSNNPAKDEFGDVLQYIREHPEVHEVILSGGDPLLFPDGKLSRLLESLAAIPHLRTVRFHTRIPIVLPERLTTSFFDVLQKTPLNKVMVVHCNHANELDERVAQVCTQLRAIGCHLLNQSVLLAQINNNVDTLAQLSFRLFECGILPYYLHLLDKVQGAAHFDVSEAESLSLFNALQHRLPGYLVPRLTREEPGKLSKTLINQPHVNS